MLSRAVYSTVLRAITPLILLRLLWRSRRAPAYRRRWRERFGFVPTLPEPPIWLHAVSVGETLAAAPLIRALLERHPRHPVLVTSTTPTGSERVRALFGERVHHTYLPYDTPGAVRRFHERSRPCVGIVMETEIWPNLMAAAVDRGVPMVLANARLSARSARGYTRLGRLARDAVSGFTVIAAQAEADAERFRALGADAERVTVTGSIKFDQRVPAAALEGGEALRRRLGAGRTVWVAASTHEGEETAALAAHRALRERHPDALLILVPRHPERFDAVAALVRREGLTLARRTAESADDAEAAVFLGDTMGELPLFLAAGDVAFVGGSLVPVGGHNLLEPAALAKPVLTGPHTFNFERVHELLAEAGGLISVADSNALAGSLTALVDDPPRREAVGRAAEGVVAANRGALEQLLSRIDSLL